MAGGSGRAFLPSVRPTIESGLGGPGMTNRAALACDGEGAWVPAEGEVGGAPTLKLGQAQPSHERAMLTTSLMPPTP